MDLNNNDLYLNFVFERQLISTIQLHSNHFLEFHICTRKTRNTETFMAMDQILGECIF